jgi:transcriptional regulator with GAF, ATPase, and Fis domain
MQQTSFQQAYLIIRHGQRWTDVLKLIPGQSVVVGRSSENHVVIRDERASRRHAEFFHQNGGWSVRDLGSRNGTAVDRKNIEGEHLLNECETITVAGCEMVFAHDLATVFSTFGGKPGGKSTDQITLDGSETPTITHRKNRSQWSSVHDAPTLDSAALPSTSDEDPATFFYRLVFDLVSCETAESLAQTALDRLLTRLNLSCGGVVTLSQNEDRHDKDPPMMAVLATKQPPGQAYHRIGDFLVNTVIQERQAVLARNVRNDEQISLARASGQRDAGSILCAPLCERDRVIGLLHIYSTADERSLNDRDLELAIGVADNLAIALLRQRSNEQLAQTLAKTRRQIDQLQSQLEVSREMVGSSPALMKVRKSIARAAPTSATVLVRGESGVGKELVARAIHGSSPRRDGPLICLNCAALAPTLLESELFGHEKGAFTGATDRKIGKFEAADGGTLLLDEIGEMSPDLQAKFLRVLEGQSFERLGGNRSIKTDVRVIAATNRDLEEAVNNKQFRSDLYYRLRVIEMEVPALRDRMEDLPLLVEHFIQVLKHHADRRIDGIEPEALELLCRHSWPGNVRELRNAIERAIVLGSSNVLEADDFSISALGQTSKPLAVVDATSFQPKTLDEIEQAHILATLTFAEGNKTKAAQLLGIERSTLDRKLKRY